MTKVIFTSLALIFSCFVIAQDKEATNNEKFDFLNEKTTIKDPFELRDPFRKVEAEKKKRKAKTFQVKKNNYSNIKSMGNVKLEDIRIIGIFIGKERRAMAKIGKNSNDVFMLREGTRLGSENAEVKAILPGGVVIVEQITNVYNQDEYIETIIPVQNE